MTRSEILISFDIDGTLEVGDPPGLIPVALVRRARGLGYIVGSSSDRVVSEERKLWETHAVEMDFIGHKHHLDQIKARYTEVGRWIHIGDTHVDEHYALIHGFEFYLPDGLPSDGRNGPRKLDSALSEIFLRFQATNLTLA